MNTKQKSRIAAQTHFGQLFAAMRENRGIRQQDIALETDTAISTVSKQERSTDCHLRAKKLRDIAEYLHSVAELTPEELSTLRSLGTVGADWTPKASRSYATPSPAATVSLDGFSGRARDACQLIHEQILTEAGASAYLPALLATAERLGVRLDIPRSNPNATGDTD